MKRRFVFYYPVKKIGGAQLLFSRLADRLCLLKEEVVIIDFADGFISQYLKSKNLNFTHTIFQKENKVTLLKEDVLIVSASFIPAVERNFEINSQTNLFFWELHPFALIEQLGLSGIYKKISNLNQVSFLIGLLENKSRVLLKNFVEGAIEKNGFSFMCGKNKDFNTKILNLSANIKTYLPIPLESKINDFASQENGKNQITIGWLSRLDADKSLIVKRLIDDLPINGNVNLSIIGDGNAMDDLKLYSRKRDNIFFTGRLEKERLNHFLGKNIDIGIAIGTSALEFSSRGIATVLMPGVNEISQFARAKYLWFFNSENKNLSALKAKTEKCMELDSIISEFRFNSQSIIERNNKYFLSNHEFFSVFELFLNTVNSCTYTYQDFKKSKISTLTNSPFNLLKEKYKSFN